MTSYMPRPGLATSLVMSALGPHPVVAVPTPLIHLLGDCTVATFLSQCLYLSDQHADAEGWFERGHEAWHADLSLSPDQIRRCIRACSGLIEVHRMGLPARNFYRVNVAAIAERLSNLRTSAWSKPAETACSIPRVSDISSYQSSQQPVVGQSAQPVTRSAPRHSSSFKKEKQEDGNPVVGQGKRDNVQPLPPVSTEMLTRLLGVWNTHRGELPEAAGLSTQRKRALTILLADCGGDVGKAEALLTDAIKEVAADKFWLDKKFGLDTLLPKTLGKAEAYRSRTQKATSSLSTAVHVPDFGVGQIVTYRRERYAIEAVTDRYIDLWDDENGSARILIHSDDIRAVRPVEVRA